MKTTNNFNPTLKNQLLTNYKTNERLDIHRFTVNGVNYYDFKLIVSMGIFFKKAFNEEAMRHYANKFLKMDDCYEGNLNKTLKNDPIIKRLDCIMTLKEGQPKHNNIPYVEVSVLKTDNNNNVIDMIEKYFGTHRIENKIYFVSYDTDYCIILQ